MHFSSKTIYIILSFFLVCLSFGCFDEEELREDLLEAPTLLQIDGQTYRIEGQVTRQVSSYPDDPVRAKIEVRLSRDSLEISNESPALDAVWLLKEKDDFDIWYSEFDETQNALAGNTRGVIQNGPRWEIGDPLTLIVQVVYQSKTYRIKQLNLSVNVR